MVEWENLHLRKLQRKQSRRRKVSSRHLQSFHACHHVHQLSAVQRCKHYYLDDHSRRSSNPLHYLYHHHTTLPQQAFECGLHHRNAQFGSTSLDPSCCKDRCPSFRTLRYRVSSKEWSIPLPDHSDVLNHSLHEIEVANWLWTHLREGNSDSHTSRSKTLLHERLEEQGIARSN